MIGFYFDRDKKLSIVDDINNLRKLVPQAVGVAFHNSMGVTETEIAEIKAMGLTVFIEKCQPGIIWMITYAGKSTI